MIRYKEGGLGVSPVPLLEFKKCRLHRLSFGCRRYYVTSCPPTGGAEYPKLPQSGAKCFKLSYLAMGPPARARKMSWCQSFLGKNKGPTPGTRRGAFYFTIRDALGLKNRQVWEVGNGFIPCCPRMHLLEGTKRGSGFCPLPPVVWCYSTT